jgi:Lamin Tail Domain
LPELAPNLLTQIEEWIRTGADCAGPPPIDAAIDAPIDADLSMPGDVQAIAAAANTITAGQRTQVTVTLTGPAPTNGQTLTLTVADSTVLGVPAALHIDQGQSSITFDVLGKRPAHATQLTAAAGTNSMSLSIAVTGLTLSEVLYQPATDESTSEWIEITNSSDVAIDLNAYSFGSGRADYTGTTVQLTGMLPPRSCFVIGGPSSNAGNGNPTFNQTFDFSPDLLNGSAATGQATGYALFNGKVNQLTSTSIPIDVVLCGQNNGAGLLGADGQPATPSCPDVAAAGHSVVRTSVTTWVDQATPTPGNCTPISL